MPPGSRPRAPSCERPSKRARQSLQALLQALADKATPSAPDAETKPKPPTLILSIDQGEELFLAEGQDEAQKLFALLRDLLRDDAPALIVVFTIRSDSYGQLQEEKLLDGIARFPSISARCRRAPMPR